jgi:hypothetical protein
MKHGRVLAAILILMTVAGCLSVTPPKTPNQREVERAHRPVDPLTPNQVFERREKEPSPALER